MDEERQASYSRYINEPGIDGRKIFDELWNTPLIQDYDPANWSPMILPINDANLKIPFVNEEIIKKIRRSSEQAGFDKVDSLFQAINFCLHPFTSKFASVEMMIDEDILRLAGTHIGVTELSDLFQRGIEKDTQKLQLFALYFAGAQAKILGFQTSTTILSMNLSDEGFLRFDNICVVTETADVEDLKKAQIREMLEGRQVSQIKSLGNRKFFKF